MNAEKTEMSRLLAVIALLGVLMTAAVMTEPAYKSVLRVSDGKAITFDGMIEEVSKSDIVFLGETHDSVRDPEDPGIVRRKKVTVDDADYVLLR